MNFKRWLLLPFLMVFLVSCKKPDASNYQANLVAGNWVVTGSAFNILVDDQKFTSDSLSFAQLSSANAVGYLPVGAGVHRITITSGNTMLVNNSFSLAAGSNYSLLLYDTLKNSQLKMLLLKDEIDPLDTLVSARFFQMIPTADSVRILFARDTLGYYTTSVYIGRLASSLTGSFPLSLPPGNYSISLSRAGTVTASPVRVTLMGGKAYTFFAKGVVGQTGNYAEGLQVLQHN